MVYTANSHYKTMRFRGQKCHGYGSKVWEFWGINRRVLARNLVVCDSRFKYLSIENGISHMYYLSNIYGISLAWICVAMICLVFIVTILAVLLRFILLLNKGCEEKHTEYKVEKQYSCL